jgi:acetoin utilization protein AcuB
MFSESQSGMLVQEFMSRDVLRVGPLTSVGEALNLMFEGKVSALPVVDENDHCFGIITATDLVVLLRATSRELNSDCIDSDNYRQAIDLVRHRLDRAPVREIMSELMVTVAPDVSIQRAAKTMADEKVHHLPVVADRRLVGFLSSVDIVAAIAGKSQQASD